MGAILQGLIAGDRAAQNRAALNFQKQKRDDDLRLKGFDPETLDIIPGSKAEAESEQVKQSIQMSKALQGKLSANETDNAIVDFSETGDANNLQRVIDNNPDIKQAWAKRGVLNVANIDWQNDKDLLNRKGFKESEYDTQEKQNVLKKNAYKFYDGKNWNIGLISNAAREAGTFNRLGKRRSSRITENAKEFRDFMAGPRSSANTSEGHKYEKFIASATEATGVPANLIAAMMNIESSNNPNAVSPKGASGLMQLMPATAKELGVVDVTDPAQNILGGAKYMAKMLEKYDGDTRLALAAYNAGPGNVDKHNGIPPFQETQKYVDKVLNNYSAGESYYSAGNEAISEGNRLGASPELNSLSNLADKQGQRSTNRIEIIRNFARGNANASKGTTNANVDTVVQTNALKAQAAVDLGRAKLASANLTTKQKDLNEADTQEKKLVSSYGGEEEFYNTDFSKRDNFNRAWPMMVKINKLQGNELTAQDKKSLVDIRSLISIAGPASQITAEQTGIIDKAVKGVATYVSNNSKGIEQKAAMAAVKNTLRHALFGSALTEGEIAAFNEAYGNNSQQLGPVLAHFKVALAQIDSKLDTVSRTGNPLTMHVLLGADKAKLENIRSALKQRIAFIDGRVNKEGSGRTVGKTKSDRPALDSIMRGTN